MKKYEILLADSPWQYKDKCHSGKRGADYKYATMSDEEIFNLGKLIRPIMAENSSLWLWVTGPKLPVVFSIIKEWGFIYKTTGFMWAKRNKIADTWFMGMGNFTRANGEICLLATKGKPKRQDASVRSLLDNHLLGHSAKPQEARDRIVRLFGDVPRLELFARDCSPGWDATGLEYDGMDVSDFLRGHIKNNL